MKSSFAFVVLSAFTALALPVRPSQDISETLQNILANTDNSDGYTYPTDLTRNIIPKPIHSHNDYWRDIPFYTALAAGCISTEADVWAINGTLYVGHEEAALTSARTLSSLYIEPILSVLNRENPTTAFTPTKTHHGVFDASSDQTLYFFIDLKTDGATTWPLVLSALEPLRSAGYLTNYTGGTDPSSSSSIQPGAITVIGTGNTPLSSFTSTTEPRDTFYDAPLALLTEPEYSNLTSLQSPIASTDFLATIGTPANGSAGFNDTQLETLRSQIAEAKSRGIGARYWDTPEWPTRTRNLIWRTLVDEGVALLNADRVEEAAGFW